LEAGGLKMLWLLASGGGGRLLPPPLAAAAAAAAGTSRPYMPLAAARRTTLAPGKMAAAELTLPAWKKESRLARPWPPPSDTPSAPPGTEALSSMRLGSRRT
jgi:hypothetical protein